MEALASSPPEIDPIDKAIEGLPPGELLAEGKARKKPGPKKGKPVAKQGAGLTRHQVAEIGRLWLECVSMEDIAERIGCQYTAVKWQLDRHFRPLWQSKIGERLEIEIAKMELLESVAWEQFHASKMPVTHKRIEEILAGKTELKPTQIKRIKQTIRKHADPSWLHIIEFCRDWFAKVGSLYGNTLNSKETGNTEPPIILEVVVGTREEAKEMMEFSDFAKRLEDARSREKD